MFLNFVDSNGTSYQQPRRQPCAVIKAALDNGATLGESHENIVFGYPMSSADAKHLNGKHLHTRFKFEEIYHEGIR